MSSVTINGVTHQLKDDWLVSMSSVVGTPKAAPNPLEKMWYDSALGEPYMPTKKEFEEQFNGAYPPETIPAPPVTLPQTKEAAQFTRQLIDKLRRWSAPALPPLSLPVAPQSSIILLPPVPPQQIAGELQLLESKMSVLAYRMDQLVEQQNRTNKQLQTLQQQQAHLTQQLNLTVQQLNLAAAQNQKMMEIMSRLDADCQERAKRSPVDQFRPLLTKRKIRQQCRERAEAKKEVS